MVTGTMRLAGIEVELNHFPFDADHDPNEIRYKHWRPADRGQVLIHGHIHGMWRTNGVQINVGMDAWESRLLHYDEVTELVRAAVG